MVLDSVINNNYLPDTEYIIFAREKGVRLYGNYYTKRKYYLSGVNQVDKKKYKHKPIKTNTKTTVIIIP